MADFLQRVQKIGLIAFLVSSMLTAGLTLTLRAIVTPLRDTRLVLLALGLNFVVAPAFAWLLTTVIPLERGYALGLLLLGSAAGAPFLPKLVEIARADLAVAATLMVLLTIGTICFLPFALQVLMPGERFDAWTILSPLLLLILLPLCVGLAGRSRAPVIAARAAPVFGKIANASLLLFCALLIVLDARLLVGVVGSGAILVALLYFGGLFIIGWLVGASNPETRGVLGLSTTARNFGVALVPAATSSSDPKTTIMVIVGAIVCLLVSFIAAASVRRATVTPCAP
jgi:predicted Na+-dependent transporter